MTSQFKIVMFFLFFFPCCAFSLNIGDYFCQGTSISNYSSQPIIVTDSADQWLKDYLMTPKDEVSVKYAQDQFTVPAGQMFSHTIDIRSASDNKLICTVQNSLAFGPGNEMQTRKPISSDETRCAVENYHDYDEIDKVQIFGFSIVVNDASF